jgi:hypothetical protein
MGVIWTRAQSEVYVMFTVDDVRDFTLLLYQHPEWRAEVRRAVLSEELLSLPEAMRDLAQAQARTEKRVGELVEAQARTEKRVGELAEAQVRTEKRVGELAEAQARTEKQVQELVEAQKRSEERLSAVEVRLEAMQESLDGLSGSMRRLTNRVGDLVGWRLEERYRQKPHSFFGRWLQAPRPADFDALYRELEARLDEKALDEVMSLDLVLRGRARHLPGTPEVWLAMEVSAMLDRGDVERARERAELLRAAGYPAIAVVAGEGITEGGTALLQGAPVVLMLDGRSQGWEEALATLV